MTQIDTIICPQCGTKVSYEETWNSQGICEPCIQFNNSTSEHDLETEELSTLTKKE